MGYGVNERIEKQSAYEKENGKSKVKLTMKTSKKQPKNVSTIVTKKKDGYNGFNC